MMIYEIYNPYIPGLVVHPLYKSPNSTKGPQIFSMAQVVIFPPQRKNPKNPTRPRPSVWRLLGLDISHSIASPSPVAGLDGARDSEASHMKTSSPPVYESFFPLQAVYNYPTTSGKYFGGEYVFLRCFPPKKIAYKFLFEVIENHAIFRMARLRGRGAENDGKGVRV